MVLAEARTRLGKKFVFDDYPSPSALETLWEAELKVDWEDPMSSLILLKEYSKFFVPPYKPDIYDAIKYARQLEKEMTKTPAERKEPPWPQSGQK